MTTSTIPYTPTAPGWTSTHPRPLGVIHPHPDLDSVATPALPIPPRPPVFHATTQGIYRLTTHLFPAAYPRVAPDIPLPRVPEYAPGGSRSARRDEVNALVKQVLETQEAYVQGRLAGESSERLLWNCVNRYVRTSMSPRPVTAAGHVHEIPSGITLFLAHANGLNKETWEPMLRTLLDAPAGEMVDEVWAWEAVQHGDAAMLNDRNQNGIYDWLDNTRDIANFLVHYLPDEVELTPLPTRLARLPPSVTKARARDGYRRRKLVVVGHSFGGTTSLRVANDFPKLFSSFVLIDPVIHRPHTFQPGGAERMMLGAFMRRDHWSSREEALEQFRKSPFFSAWHPAVLQLYVDCGLVEDPKGGVRLKMSGLQEGLSFTNRVPSWEMWEMLDKLDERITLRWVIPGDSGMFGDGLGDGSDRTNKRSTKQWTYEKVWRRPANTTNVVFHFASHLIVQEAPLELARDISDFLLRKYGSSRAHL